MKGVEERDTLVYAVRVCEDFQCEMELWTLPLLTLSLASLNL